MAGIAPYIPSSENAKVTEDGSQYGRALAVRPAATSQLAPWEREALALPETAAQAREHPVSVYLAKLTPESRQSQHLLLDRVARIISGGLHRGAMTFPWHLLRYQDMAALRASVAANFKHTTANNYLSGVRSLLEECYRLGMMTAEDYQRAVDVPLVPGESEPAGRHVTAEELDRVFDSLDQDPRPTSRRDAAAFAILRGTGMRREELVCSDLADYDPVQASLLIRRGKGNKARTVFLPPGRRITWRNG